MVIDTKINICSIIAIQNKLRKNSELENRPEEITKNIVHRDKYFKNLRDMEDRIQNDNIKMAREVIFER